MALKQERAAKPPPRHRTVILATVPGSAPGNDLALTSAERPDGTTITVLEVPHDVPDAHVAQRLRTTIVHHDSRSAKPCPVAWTNLPRQRRGAVIRTPAPCVWCDRKAWQPNPACPNHPLQG